MPPERLSPGRHFRASVVENHQGPLAHWDVRGAHDAHGAHDGETSFLPMSPGGDQQRRAFATFTEAVEGCVKRLGVEL